MNRQQEYADQEAALIKSWNGVPTNADDLVQLGRESFLAGRPLDSRETSYFVFGWLSEYNKSKEL
tara:strand:+ start:33066 stop:33260 length:195 start_codon:yes stop_codon:yes gene_type:complete